MRRPVQTSPPTKEDCVGECGLHRQIAFPTLADVEGWRGGCTEGYVTRAPLRPTHGCARGSSRNVGHEESPPGCGHVRRGPGRFRPPTSASLRPASRSSQRLDWTPRNSHDVDGVDDRVAGDGARLWGLGAYFLPLCAAWRQAHNKSRPKARGALCRSFLYSGKQPLTLKQLIF